VFKRYLKRRPRSDVYTAVTSTKPSDDQGLSGVYVETDTFDINQNDKNISSESCEQMEEDGIFNKLPLLSVDDSHQTLPVLELF